MAEQYQVGYAGPRNPDAVGGVAELRQKLCLDGRQMLTARRAFEQTSALGTRTLCVDMER